MPHKGSIARMDPKPPLSCGYMSRPSPQPIAQNNVFKSEWAGPQPPWMAIKVIDQASIGWEQSRTPLSIGWDELRSSSPIISIPRCQRNIHSTNQFTAECIQVSHYHSVTTYTFSRDGVKVYPSARFKGGARFAVFRYVCGTVINLSCDTSVVVHFFRLVILPF